MAGSIVNLGLRGFQFIFAIVILGLSVQLLRDHHWGGLPATLGFSVFVAAIAVLGSLVGIAATFVSVLEGPVGLIVDAVVALISVIGGILLAVKIGGIHCRYNPNTNDPKEATDELKMFNNELFNGGFMKIGKEKTIYWGNDPNKVVSHCKEAQADMVFMFLTVAVVFVAALMTFLRMKKGY